MVFSTFTTLYNHYYYLIPEHFIIEKPHQPHPLSSHTPFPPPIILWNTLIYFLSLWICLFCPFHVNGIIQSVTFCVWLHRLSRGVLKPFPKGSNPRIPGAQASWLSLNVPSSYRARTDDDGLLPWLPFDHIKMDYDWKYKSSSLEYVNFQKWERI